MIHTEEKYRKTEYGYLIILIILVAILLIIKTNGNSINVIFPVGILLVVMIVFHRLTIVITDGKIIAFFSFGLFKRMMKISDIDIETIELKKMNWLTGIGIRYTKNGWLYNIKPGEAIKIKSKDKSKIFFVGTDDFSRIKQIILKEFNKN